MPRRFDFVSPGIQLTEIDRSTVPTPLEGDGPLIIGLAQKGPANKPVRISSKENFEIIFGQPIYGPISSDLYPDSWRNGSRAFPHYGSIAADAWLSADESPITFIRLLGEQDANPTTNSGEAGWITSKTNDEDQAQNGGAYGLFIINSGSTANINATGTLAAIWYLEQGKIELSGTNAAGVIDQGSAKLIESLGGGTATANQFRVVISNASGSSSKNYIFNFDPESKQHIRKVFNTEAYRVNSTTETNTETYWLGETFEESVDRHVTTTGSGQQYGVILALASGSNNGADHRASYLPSKTGWFINRDANEDTGSYSSSDNIRAEKLFRLVSLHDGEDFEKNYYVEIKNLSLGRLNNPKSTFSVVIKTWGGQTVETFSNLNLDPGDSDFVGRRIGTQYREWDATDKKYNIKGRYPNLSDFVYVELAENLETGIGPTDAFAIPFGFYGPVKFKGFAIVSGSTDTEEFGGGTAFASAFVEGSGSIPTTGVPASEFASLFMRETASFVFPDVKLTVEEAYDPGNTNFAANNQATVLGIWPRRDGKLQRDDSYIDLVRAMPTNYDVHANSPSGNMERSFIFTLDEVVYDTGSAGMYYESGSRASGDSQTALSGTQALIDLNFGGFSAPFFGGKDGLDIKNKDPFAEALIGSTKVGSYEFNTLQKVIDIAKDPENVSMDILSMPGQRDDDIIDDLIAAADERQDCLAIVDAPQSYTTIGDARAESAVSVSDAVSTARGRNYDSSYGAMYYPWVLLNNDQGGANVYVPPSVAAIGAMAASQKATAPWFAPAGFNRGGLSRLGGPNGPQVVGVAETLNKANRDKLYETGINPIARFGDNIVIFGQKTLQATPSALDRINVRRLMIYIKKRIGTIAENVLFDQNINTTWRRFTSAAERVLNQVKSGGGITEYKLILDNTTTTPDLVDRNILYAKVLIKPARAIEFIAVDFVITRSGVQF